MPLSNPIVASTEFDVMTLVFLLPSAALPLLSVLSSLLVARWCTSSLYSQHRHMLLCAVVARQVVMPAPRAKIFPTPNSAHGFCSPPCPQKPPARRSIALAWRFCVLARHRCRTVLLCWFTIIAPLLAEYLRQRSQSRPSSFVPRSPSSKPRWRCDVPLRRGFLSSYLHSSKEDDDVRFQATPHCL